MLSHIFFFFGYLSRIRNKTLLNVAKSKLSNSKLGVCYEYLLSRLTFWFMSKLLKLVVQSQTTDVQAFGKYAISG